MRSSVPTAPGNPNHPRSPRRRLDILIESPFWWSAVRQKMLENLGAELQRIDGYPLVDAVEQRGEVQIRRQLQWGEAEAANPQARECLCIGATGKHVGHDAGAGIDGDNRGVHRVHKVAVERRL